MSTASIAILGATGAIGTCVADVLERNPGRFSVRLLAAKSDWRGMLSMCERLRPEQATLDSAPAAEKLLAELRRKGLPTQVAAGAAATEQLLVEQPADTVVAAITGVAGLPSLLAAVRSGARILLANKEALVVAGEHLLSEVKARGATLVPLDSEHNAIFQCVGGNFQPGEPLKEVQALTLTASGGPFLRLPMERFADIAPEEAVAHPNWTMGAKISVDSATMMNKGLELIEARLLFGLPPDALHVLVQPQSLLHSLVHYCDGSVIAHFAQPDMRVPIAAALCWPQRLQSGVAQPDLARIGSVQFEEPDLQRFPCLSLARQAMQAGGTAPAVLNAANEVAVEAFLNRRIRFDQIAELVDGVLQEDLSTGWDSGSDAVVGEVFGDVSAGLQQAVTADRCGRRLAEGWMHKLSAEVVPAVVPAMGVAQ